MGGGQQGLGDGAALKHPCHILGPGSEVVVGSPLNIGIAGHVEARS